MKLRVRALLWVAGVSCASLALAPVHPSHAQGDADTPRPAALQIELGDHAGPIRRIAADARRQIVVTGSDDKTARSWSLDDGRSLRVVRPPAAAAEAGRVYGVALHPSLPLMAVGGTSGDTNAHAIRVHDVHTGQLVRRIDARAGDVKRLLWMPDGALLVAAYAGSHGVRAFDAGGQPVFADAFDAEVYALAAAPGLLAAASLDGSLRVYEVAGARVRLRTQLKLSRDPASLSFSPDARSLAVGYFAPGKGPEIVEWEQGKVHALPVPHSLRHEDLRAVAWSAKAPRILAGGSYGFAARQVALVSYDAVRRSVVKESVAAASSVTDIAALHDGRFAYAAADGSWGTADGEAAKALRSSPLPDLAGASRLRVSPDGRRISWMLGTDESSRVLFDLDARRLLSGSAAQPGAALRLPILRRGLFGGASDWENTKADRPPAVNGKRIALAADEVSRAVSLFASGGDAVLGTSRALYRIAADGNVAWRVPMHTEVRAVNVADGDRIIVAAMLDGTLRFVSSLGGQELMALLALRDGRWIAWTPSGHYDASPGAEDLIGWRVDRGEDLTADYFPASRLRTRFYRPDIVDRALASAAQGLQAPTFRQSDGVQLVQALPPVVDLLSERQVRTGLRQVPLRIRVRTHPDAPVSDVQVRVNGLPIRGLPVSARRADGAGELHEIEVPLPPSDAHVQVFAENRHGTSEPATVQVTWAGEAVAAAPSLPRLFVVAIGVSQYRQVEPLDFAAKDAADFVSVMKSQAGLRYESVQARTVVDRDATRQGIVQALEWLKAQTNSGDVGMVFLAGHGVNVAEKGYHFLPVDADPRDPAASGISSEVLRQTVGELKGKAVAFIDTCHSGDALRGAWRLGGTADVNGLINELASPESGVLVFSASSGRQPSVESPDWNNGVFTLAIVEGMGGAADAWKTGNIMHKALDSYVSHRVAQLTGGEQTPLSEPGGMQDFLLAKVKAHAVPPARPMKKRRVH